MGLKHSEHECPYHTPTHTYICTVSHTHLYTHSHRNTEIHLYAFSLSLTPSHTKRLKMNRNNEGKT